MASAGSFDLILMDVNLGEGIDGGDAARQILANRGPPVIFLSSHVEPEVIAKTKDAGGYGYIVKGTGPVVLLTSIQMAIDLSSAIRQLSINEMRWETIAQAAPYIIFSLDLDRRITWINRPLSKGKGYSGAYGMSIYDIIDERSLPAVREAIDGVFTDGIVRSYRASEHVVSGRSEHVWETIIGAIRDGDRIAGLTLVSKDVTELGSIE